MATRTDFHGFWLVFWIIFRSFFHKFRDCQQIRKMSFWYSIHYVLGTSACWKVRKSQMLDTFSDIFSRWLPTSFCHRFWVDLDSILGCFLMIKSEKRIPKNTAKTYLQKCHAGDPRRSQEIWEWILWSLKTIQGSQIQGLVNLTKGLETLHWCLAARWRIN